MNITPYNEALEIPLMESFYSVQGEGFHTGRPAFFIRFAGCDVGCSWCDVKESWDAAIHPLIQINKIVDEVLKSGTNFVVITGGEPAMYNLIPLTEALKKNNIGYVCPQKSLKCLWKKTTQKPMN